MKKTNTKASLTVVEESESACKSKPSELVTYIQKTPSRRSKSIYVNASPRSVEFMKKNFPNIGLTEWNDWKWQVRSRYRTAETLRQIINLAPSEEEAVTRYRQSLPLGITPYYATLLDPDNHLQPIRKTVVPVVDEFTMGPGESKDPLGEDADSPVPGLVHRYPDRVLFLSTAFCSVYCRYCTRSRAVGNFAEYKFNRQQWEKALEYIENTPSIRDVLISGGDAFDLADEHLEYLISRLKKIKHVEFVRLGTKVPAVLPQRITPALVKMLKKYAPIWLSLHFTHPDELTPETAEACNRLSDAGIPLGSQTVLLKGINDNSETLKELFHGLLKIRVRPYYVYQCDPIAGSAHFRTPVEQMVQIVKELRGHTTGYAIPTFVIDGPGGGGKIPIQPQYLKGREGDNIVLENFAGEKFYYPDPL